MERSLSKILFFKINKNPYTALRIKLQFVCVCDFFPESVDKR